MLDTHLPAAYRFALALTGNESDATAVVQRVFSSWMDDEGPADEQGSLRHRLLASVYTQCLRAFPLRPILDAEAAAAEEDRPERAFKPVALESLSGSEVMHAMQRVEFSLRAPLILFFLEGAGCTDIADILGLSSREILARLSRGKARLREELAALVAARQFLPA